MLKVDVSYAREGLQHAYAQYLDSINSNYMRDTPVSAIVMVENNKGVEVPHKVTGVIELVSVYVSIVDGIIMTHAFTRINLDYSLVPFHSGASDTQGKTIMIDILKPEYNITIEG